MFKTEAVIIGAGIIGLAIARALAARGVEVLVLEQGDDQLQKDATKGPG